MVKFVGVLSSVCIIAAIVLGLTYSITKPIIAEQSAKEQRQALEKVVPGADTYKQKVFSKGEYYECLKDKKLIGYALFVSGTGYSGDIKMLLGIDKTGKILGVEILAQSETPGLGARCVEVKRGQSQPWFLAQFKGKNASSLKLKDIQTITGSTITSKAVLESLKNSTEGFLKEIR
ncbi:MAG: RnfABCDGE type electron transport complex subunit G [Dehalococcoidia bacterium]|nr:MAG: RnfABCDGE type electron transport complex subunit G [Dehalococcoidia bacterium]